MADGTKIEWTDATWNPITGCALVSPGCTNCYAMKLAGTRLRNIQSRAGLTRDTKAGPVWTGEIRFNAEWLDQPLRWRRPRMIFVCAHGDLFAPGVTDEMLDQVFAVMALAPQHTFQVLTKRPERMRDYLTADGGFGPWGRVEHRARQIVNIPPGKTLAHLGGGSLPNVWLGVSAEDQRRADERIPILLDTPAALRWVSAEPLLGPIDFKRFCPTKRLAILISGEPVLLPHFYMTKCERCGWIGSSELCGIDTSGDDSDVYCPACHSSICGDDAPGIDWVVAGGESGHGARPMHPDWARSIRDQCAKAEVPFLFKQWGEWAPICAIDTDAMYDNLYHPALARHGSKGPRRCKVAQCILHSDGTQFDLDEWSRTHPSDDWRRTHAAGSGHMLTMAIGKKAAGRLLDGVQHDGYPEIGEAA